MSEFKLMRVLGLAAFVVAAIAFSIARKPPPQEADLTWHEGRVAKVEKVAEAPTDKTQPSILFSVAGLAKAFQHERKKPAFDTLLKELTKGATVAVLYDPTEDRRFTRAWSVKKDGRTLLTYADMKAWDKDNKRFGLSLAIVISVGGLILTVLGFKGKRKGDPPPG